MPEAVAISRSVVRINRSNNIWISNNWTSEYLMRGCFTYVLGVYEWHKASVLRGCFTYAGNVGVNIPVPMGPLGIDEVLGNYTRMRAQPVIALRASFD